MGISVSPHMLRSVVCPWGDVGIAVPTYGSLSSTVGVLVPTMGALWKLLNGRRFDGTRAMANVEFEMFAKLEFMIQPCVIFLMLVE